MAGTLRGKWRRDVLRTSTVSDAVKLLLIALADHGMNERGYVSVPRIRLAELLGREPRRITERIQAARKAGWLDTVGRAHPGRTAVYVATFPDRNGGRSTATKSDRNGGRKLATNRGADGGPPFPRGMVAAPQPPIGKRDSPTTGTPDHRSAPALGSEEKNNQPLPAYGSDPWMETA